MSESKAPKGIVAKIMAIFELGEAGKVGAVYGKLENAWAREVIAHKSNLKVKQIKYDDKVIGLQDELEEAKLAIEDVWMSVTPDTAAEIRPTGFAAFKADFDSRLNRAEKQLDDVNDRIEEAQEDFRVEKELINDQIAVLESRIKEVKG